MKRMEVACWSLIASAFVLSGILCVMMDGRALNRAEASQVISRDSYTLLTAKTRNNEEALFVLENTTQRLLVYTLDVGKGRIDLAADVFVPDMFNAAGIAPAGGGGSRGPARRDR